MRIYTRPMRLTLPSIRRSLPLRVLAAIAWWMLVLPVFAANMPMTATVGAMPAMHAANATIHHSVSVCGATSMQTGCCPDHHRSAHHLGCTCHCPASCTGLLLSTDYDAALAFVVYADEGMLAVANAPSPDATPPLRPPAA
ncbi:hypothetical protein [Dyella sp.]|uniref:hypothetical protein n=1 Tax=Dyella sp. TaxID=1869338 RepID=UPI002B48DAE8|nr:hypothetical protein [Dyella sp.]